MTANDLGACEWFVWDLRRSGLIDRGPLDAAVADFLRKNPRAEAPALAEHLVAGGALTAFQADRVLAGKTQGLVLGPYVLLDAIGAGSMGQVYRATSKTDGAAYAVKVLPRRSMWNVRLARRQVRSFAGFSHPAVVPFVDVGTAGGLHYLVWPVADGLTLERLVVETGKLPPGQAALVALQTAQGLAAAHANTLFHGLLKPSNVMVGADGQARLLDFGIGSLLVENEGESLVDTMSTANTLTSGLDCAAPESIMEPTNRTPAGDQYSLGCVLYYALTGRVPFPDESAVEKMMAHQTKEPTPVRELVPEVPDGLAAVVARLMSKNPDGRYGGCDEVVEALEPFADPVPVSGKRSGRVPVPAGGSRFGTRTPTPTLPEPGGRWSGGAGPGGSKVPGAGSKVPSLGSKVPGAGSRVPGAGSHVPGMGSHVPGMGSKVPGVGGPKPPAGSNPGTRTPVPSPSRSVPTLPSRASFQLPPIAEELPADEPALKRKGKPAEVAEPIADDAAEPAERGGGIGPMALVAGAVAIMVAVYFVAMVVMK